MAMVLLGVGWNFMFIGGTTLLTDSIFINDGQFAVIRTVVHLAGVEIDESVGDAIPAADRRRDAVACGLATSKPQA
jgi:hypothetical protein